LRKTYRDYGKMIRTIDEVLSPEEVQGLRDIEKQISDKSQAKIVINVAHIECEDCAEKTEASTYFSPRNPFIMLYNTLMASKRSMSPKAIARMTSKKRENLLFKSRLGHVLEFEGRRHERVAYELMLRKEEIMAHKWYLSRRMAQVTGEKEYDAGLFIAAAHWLREHSAAFYDTCRRHHKRFRVDFSLKGMEKAVVIKAPGDDGNDFYSVIVMSKDLKVEEDMAQVAAGVLTKPYDVAKKVREELVKAEQAMHFYVLKTQR
jgi:hypothetical protein